MNTLTEYLEIGDFKHQTIDDYKRENMQQKNLIHEVTMSYK
jgi:hypothetical protein